MSIEDILACYKQEDYVAPRFITSQGNRIKRIEEKMGK